MSRTYRALKQIAERPQTALRRAPLMARTVGATGALSAGSEDGFAAASLSLAETEFLTRTAILEEEQTIEEQQEPASDLALPVGDGAPRAAIISKPIADPAPVDSDLTEEALALLRTRLAKAAHLLRARTDLVPVLKPPGSPQIKHTPPIPIAPLHHPDSSNKEGAMSADSRTPPDRQEPILVAKGNANGTATVEARAPDVTRDAPNGRAEVSPISAWRTGLPSDLRDLRNRMLADLPGVGEFAIGVASVAPWADHCDSLARLALGLVAVERGVLIVDATGKGRAWASLLGVAHQPGLCELLAGQRQLDELIIRTSQPGLAFLPAGDDRLEAGAAADPALLTKCKRRYPIVLVDLGSLSGPAAEAMARQCDATYLVVELGRTYRQPAIETSRQLQASGVRLTGTVIVGG